ncbi:MAG TPA: condensation domain-containing protein, partial [Nonomuraea sp.]|nr:condensation domain-containing protein [Nonomuraea sp.]
MSETFADRGVRRTVTSSVQDELWFLQKLIPESPAHNVCRAYRVRGPLDVGALRAAWRSVVCRHEILRTTLVEVDGLPVQRIADDWDERSFVEPGPYAAPGRLAATPFDLATGPLARLYAAATGADEHVLTVVAHEAAVDEESMSMLVEELSAVYAGGGSQAPARYAEYAEWQRERSSTPEFHRLLDQWT